jgi:hypothetical protein
VVQQARGSKANDRKFKALNSTADLKKARQIIWTASSQFQLVHFNSSFSTPVINILSWGAQEPRETP